MPCSPTPLTPRSQYPSAHLALSRAVTGAEPGHQRFCKETRRTFAVHSFYLQPFKDVKAIFSSWVTRVLAAGWIWPWGP